MTLVLFVHNLPYLGNQAGDVLRGFALNSPEKSPLPDWANTMPLPLGMLYADHINTVSEGYAKEMQTKEFGSGLDRFIYSKRGDLSGIVNGLDTQSWDPATDKNIVLCGYLWISVFDAGPAPINVTFSSVPATQKICRF